MIDTKYEWRKRKKDLYLPKARPEIVEIPNHKFLAIQGEGNPNSPFLQSVLGSYLRFLMP